MLTVLMDLLLKNPHTTLFCTCLTVLGAFQDGVLHPEGVLVVIAFATLCFFYFFNKKMKKEYRYAVISSIIILVYILISHISPGFCNPVWERSIRVSSTAPAFSMFVNVDSLLCAFILSGTQGLQMQENKTSLSSLKKAGLASVVCVAVLLGPAWIGQYIHWDPKWPAITGSWTIHNFLFICYYSEVIFRRFLQRTLTYDTKNPFWVHSGILLTAVLFGLYHYGMGWAMVGFSTVAGLFYGYTYFLTGHILYPMGVHFIVNAVHFFLFTYPIQGALTK